MTNVTLARVEFAFVTINHFFFVPVTIGLAFLVAVMQTVWYRTDNPDYKVMTRFFGTLLLINVAIGVVTGLVQEFQFGMNWSVYSRFVGGVFGAPLAMEGLVAFFLGLGIAAHRSFVSYIATVVEVAVDAKGNISVPRVDTAIDCGFYVNPERIRSQIEGAAVMGLSLAKYGEITLKNGRIEQGNFNDYPVVRHDESPAVTNTHIVENGIDVPSSGVGEPGVPPFAPALCNAIFAATGKRIRRLPIGNQLA